MINAYNFDELYRAVGLEFKFMLAIKSIPFISYFLFFNTFANKITVIVVWGQDGCSCFKCSRDKMIAAVLVIRVES